MLKVTVYDWKRSRIRLCICILFQFSKYSFVIVEYNSRGGGWPVVACTFRALVVTFRMLAIFTWYEMIDVCILFYIYSRLGPWTYPSNNGLNKLPWTSCISDLYTKLLIVGRGDPGLANDSPCGVWAVDKPLASCIKVHFRLMFFVTVGVFGPWANHLPLVWWSIVGRNF